MNIKAVLFDIDDTLFDRETAQKRVLEILVQRFPGILGEFEMARLMEAWHESDRLAIVDFDSSAPSATYSDRRSRIFLRLLGAREDAAKAVTKTYFDEYPGIDAPVDGAADLLKKIGLKYKSGIISNSYSDVQHRKLATIGILELFSCIVLSEEFGLRKPGPRIFHHAAGLLGVHPSECLYVGDSYKADIIGARAAGMYSCWFNRGGRSSLPDLALSPDIEISRLGELEEILNL